MATQLISTLYLNSGGQTAFGTKGWSNIANSYDGSESTYATNACPEDNYDVKSYYLDGKFDLSFVPFSSGESFDFKENKKIIKVELGLSRIEAPAMWASVAPNPNYGRLYASVSIASSSYVSIYTKDMTAVDTNSDLIPEPSSHTNWVDITNISVSPEKWSVSDILSIKNRVWQYHWAAANDKTDIYNYLYWKVTYVRITWEKKLTGNIFFRGL